MNRLLLGTFLDASSLLFVRFFQLIHTHSTLTRAICYSVVAGIFHTLTASACRALIAGNPQQAKRKSVSQQLLLGDRQTKVPQGDRPILDISLLCRVSAPTTSACVNQTGIPQQLLFPTSYIQFCAFPTLSSIEQPAILPFFRVHRATFAISNIPTDRTRGSSIVVVVASTHTFGNIVTI
jgi:hypothetical protein